MRNPWVWSLAALIAAAGCSGNSGKTDSTVQGMDEHEGPPEVCEQCFVTGGGVFLLGDQRVTFGLNAVPADGKVEGHIEIQFHGEGGTNVFGDVDKIVSCSRSDHDLFGTFSGTLRNGGTFEVTVKDAGEPGRADTIEFSLDTTHYGPFTLLHGGNLQVHSLAQCQPPPSCEPGFCICPDNGQCEPCPEPEPVTTTTTPPPPIPL